MLGQIEPQEECITYTPHMALLVSRPPGFPGFLCSPEGFHPRNARPCMRRTFIGQLLVIPLHHGEQSGTTSNPRRKSCQWMRTCIGVCWRLNLGEPASLLNSLMTEFKSWDLKHRICSPAKMFSPFQISIFTFQDSYDVCDGFPGMGPSPAPLALRPRNGNYSTCRLRLWGETGNCQSVFDPSDDCNSPEHQGIVLLKPFF